MKTPDEILNDILRQASNNIERSFIDNDDIRSRVEHVCREKSNRACARLIMACMLAKIHKPSVDPRKPYTEIGTNDSFSGRSYDEDYITRFIHENRLPLNPTTAFLTPAFRNLNRELKTGLKLSGRPSSIYEDTLQLLDDVHQNKVTADNLLTEMVRVLLLMQKQHQDRLNSLLAELSTENTLPLSAEEIVALIEQHLKCKNSSRLPVLIVAAAYNSVEDKLGERILPLQSHNAADKQTGSLGDVEVCLENDKRVVTVYEMKMKKVTIDDINRAIEKISSTSERIHNYIFITTDVISDDVKLYAEKCYEQTGGTEFHIFDCISFLRHFLHFFSSITRTLSRCLSEPRTRRT